MTLQVAVKAPSSPSPNAVALALLHLEGHFRLIKRKLCEFGHLERQLQLESKRSRGSASVLPAIEAYCDAKPSFYSSSHLRARLAVALEDFVLQLVANSELLSESTAVHTFFDETFLSSRESYRNVMESKFSTDKTEMMEESVAAGCSTECPVAVDEEQVVVWKFVSQGSGLVFSAEFSSREGNEVEINPYSVNSKEEEMEGDKEVVWYRSNCWFNADGENNCVYGHFTALKRGIVTLQWENENMDSVVSKPLQCQVNVLPLEAAKTVLDVANGSNGTDSAEWVHQFVLASKITSLKDLHEWESYDIEASMFEDTAFGDNLVKEKVVRDIQFDRALLEERTLQLEAQLHRLEKSRTDREKELKSARDRVEFEETINKANLEVITQLERANAGTASKLTKKAEQMALTPVAVDSGTHQEELPSSELERAQKLCASFQEQCLWRSVENMELETHLAAAQVEVSSWRQKHDEQAARIAKLEKQNCALRSHKKMLVDEVKRLQPYSRVNLAALVQEAQEARMMQRSLQAKLDAYEQLKRAEAAAESTSSDFVLVEASDDEQ